MDYDGAQQNAGVVVPLFVLHRIGADDVRADHARLAYRAVSSLASLTEAEITAGLRAVARDAREGDGPVRQVQDLTTFARRTGSEKG